MAVQRILHLVAGLTYLLLELPAEVRAAFPDNDRGKFKTSLPRLLKDSSIFPFKRHDIRITPLVGSWWDEYGSAFPHSSLLSLSSVVSTFVWSVCVYLP